MTLSIDPGHSVPLHAQVESLLRTMIREPAYRKGKLLPPETELAMRLGISRSTLRAGIERLVNEGLLVRKRGHGTRVVPPGTHSSRMESWESFTREMAAQGVAVQTFTTQYELRRAPAVVADAFEIKRNTRIYVLERVRGFEDKRVVHFLSWFHPRLKLTGDEDFARPLYEVLESTCCVRAQHSHECITAVAADDVLAGALEVPVGAPLLKRERRVTDPGDRPIEYAINHYRCDRFEYTIDITRKTP
ncbi:GntR family transcriptional regulator [Planctomycetales bacterium ZRK34]|nr:GntR family transcriptional regulator [Planctomycetales bacterium ZRK34]